MSKILTKLNTKFLQVHSAGFAHYTPTVFFTLKTELQQQLDISNLHYLRNVCN